MIDKIKTEMIGPNHGIICDPHIALDTRHTNGCGIDDDHAFSHAAPWNDRRGSSELFADLLCAQLAPR